MTGSSAARASAAANPAGARRTSRARPPTAARAGAGPPRSPSVRSVLADVVVDGVVGLDRLARVAPKPFEDVVRHCALADEPVVDIGDLELAPTRRLQRRDHFEDTGVVEID